MTPATYAFYRETYIGSDVPQNAFDACAMRAAQQLFCDTNGASASSLLANDTNAESVRLAVCAVAEIIYKAKNIVQSGVLKESAGTVSRTYSSNAQSAVKSEIAAAEALYLGHTGMLYKGR